MKSNDYIQALLTSTQTLMDKAIAENNFSNQNNFQATIIEKIDEPENGVYFYKAINNNTNQNIKVYANTNIYKINDKVLVLRPGATDSYYVLGYYFDSELNKVIQYEDPEKNILKAFSIKLDSWNVPALKLNNSEQETKIYSNLIQLNNTGRPHDRLYIETKIFLDLFSQDDFYNNAFMGEYGLGVEIYENLTSNIYIYDFNNSLMYGNVYQQNRDTQRIVFDISNIKKGVPLTY